LSRGSCSRASAPQSAWSLIAQIAQERRVDIAAGTRVVVSGVPTPQRKFAAAALDLDQAGYVSAFEYSRRTADRHTAPINDSALPRGKTRWLPRVHPTTPTTIRTAGGDG
jgi:hypothetical protein